MDAVRDLDRTPAAGQPRPRRPARPAQPVSNTSHARYLEMVETAKDYIRAGDIFQVVPEPALGAAVRPAALRALPRAPPHQPLALHVLLQLRRLPGGRRQPRDPGAASRAAPSPIRPIAGTRPRGATPGRGPRPRGRAPRRPQGAGRAPDAARPRPQRRRPGGARSARVDPNEQFIIERYSHVMHIVSNVDGELAAGQDALSALLAGLPAGTVSGAPEGPGDADHRRARGREARRLRRRRRLFRRAAATWTSASRCAPRVVKDGTLYIQAGGGVVYDSDPEAEFQETRQQVQGADPGRPRRRPLRRAAPRRQLTRAATCRSAAHDRGVYGPAGCRAARLMNGGVITSEPCASTTLRPTSPPSDRWRTIVHSTSGSMRRRCAILFSAPRQGCRRRSAPLELRRRHGRALAPATSRSARARSFGDLRVAPPVRAPATVAGRHRRRPPGSAVEHPMIGDRELERSPSVSGMLAGRRRASRSVEEARAGRRTPAACVSVSSIGADETVKLHARPTR